MFYVTKAPASFQDITKGGGWSPDGSGVFTEEITLAADGNSYTAKVTYVAYDVNGKPAAGGGAGTRHGYADHVLGGTRAGSCRAAYSSS